MLARLPLILLLALFAVACGNSAPPPSDPTAISTSTPTSTPATSSTPSLATMYDVDEADFFTITQLWDEYLKSESGEATRLKGGKSIIIEGCHAQDSVKVGQDLWIAFSPDGDFVLKDNVILVTGFATLPEVDCYEMVLKYRGTKKHKLTSQNVATFQRFRLVDEDAIRKR